MESKGWMHIDQLWPVLFGCKLWVCDRKKMKQDNKEQKGVGTNRTNEMEWKRMKQSGKKIKLPISRCWKE